MTFAAKLDDQGRVLIPQDVRERFALGEDAEVELEVIQKVVPAPAPRDLTKLEAALNFYGGSKRESFLADGYTSIKEYMNDLRGR